MLIDNDGNEILKPHTIGEICVDVNYCSVGIFKGYYKNQELTEKVFSGGIYHTGDLAYFDKENKQEEYKYTCRSWHDLHQIV